MKAYLKYNSEHIVDTSLPVNCEIELDPDEYCSGKILRVTLTSSEGASEIRYAVPSMRFTIGIRPNFKNPFKAEVIFDLLDPNDNLVSGCNKTASFSGIGFMPIRSYSMYNRMESDLEIVDIDKMMTDSGSSIIKKSNSIIPPDIQGAVSILRSIYKCLRTFDIKRTVSKEMMVQTKSLIDVSEDLSGNIYELSLLGCHILARKGFDPVMVCTETICLFGVTVEDICIDDPRYKCCTIRQNGELPVKTILIDIGIDSFDESLKKAKESFSNKHTTCVSSIERRNGSTLITTATPIRDRS